MKRILLRLIPLFVVAVAGGLAALSGVAGAQEEVPLPPGDTGGIEAKWTVVVEGRVVDGKLVDYEYSWGPYTPLLVEPERLKVSVHAQPAIRELDGGDFVEAVNLVVRTHGTVRLGPPPQTPGAVVYIDGYSSQVHETAGNRADHGGVCFKPKRFVPGSGSPYDKGLRSLDFETAPLIEMNGDTGQFNLVIELGGIVTPSM